MAEAIRVTERTLLTWRGIALFQAELVKARNAYLRECIDMAKADLATLGPEALQCLREAMRKGGGPGVKAALALAQATGLMQQPEENKDAFLQLRSRDGASGAVTPRAAGSVEEGSREPTHPLSGRGPDRLSQERTGRADGGALRLRAGDALAA